MADHERNACWKCHDWEYIELNGRKVAVYCKVCALTVDEWVAMQFKPSTLASKQSEKNQPPGN